MACLHYIYASTKNASTELCTVARTKRQLPFATLHSPHEALSIFTQSSALACFHSNSRQGRLVGRPKATIHVRYTHSHARFGRLWSFPYTFLKRSPLSTKGLTHTLILSSAHCSTLAVHWSYTGRILAVHCRTIIRTMLLCVTHNELPIEEAENKSENRARAI